MERDTEKFEEVEVDLTEVEEALENENWEEINNAVFSADFDLIRERFGISELKDIAESNLRYYSHLSGIIAEKVADEKGVDDIQDLEAVKKSNELSSLLQEGKLDKFSRRLDIYEEMIERRVLSSSNMSSELFLRMAIFEGLQYEQVQEGVYEEINRNNVELTRRQLKN